MMTRTPVDQMLDIAVAFTSQIRIGRSLVLGEKYWVDIKNVSYRENKHDIMARGIFGRGNTVEEACADFLSQAKGKILFGDNRSFYGDEPPEFICL